MGGKKVTHAGHRERVREKYVNNGINSFADHEVLEFLLFYALPRRDTNELAHKMINEFGSLHNLMDAHPSEISRRCKVSISVAALVTLPPQIHKKYVASKMAKKNPFHSTKAVGTFLISLFAAEVSECFYILCLDSQQKLISSELITRGTLNHAQIYLRSIMEAALKHHACSVVLSHNHPNNDLTPSDEDISTTEKIVEAFESIDVAVLDHVIVNTSEYYSFKENNYL
ncbi:MAG: DNA repair protein RadC [Clostridiales bacterium]|jgi:DNA repair protein RadC|nr:DNA repair protein RadC [Clostridiales bacterium]